jgi:hypothetical protein
MSKTQCRLLKSVDGLKSIIETLFCCFGALCTPPCKLQCFRSAVKTDSRTSSSCGVAQFALFRMFIGYLSRMIAYKHIWLGFSIRVTFEDVNSLTRVPQIFREQYTAW